MGNVFIGEIVLKNNTVYIRPNIDFKYNIIFKGDSSKLKGGYKVIFKLKEKISDYNYTAEIIKVLEQRDNFDVQVFNEEKVSKKVKSKKLYS